MEWQQKVNPLCKAPRPRREKAVHIYCVPQRWHLHAAISGLGHPIQTMWMPRLSQPCKSDCCSSLLPRLPLLQNDPSQWTQIRDQIFPPRYHAVLFNPPPARLQGAAASAWQDFTGGAVTTLCTACLWLPLSKNQKAMTGTLYLVPVLMYCICKSYKCAKEAVIRKWGFIFGS